MFHGPDPAALAGLDAVVCPPYTLLRDCVDAGLTTYAQNVHWEQEGAYTGEISPPLLQELGVVGSLVGHSERRQHFGESDETVARRTRGALDAGLRVIACIGETQEQREAGETEDVLRRQLAVLEPHPDLVLAYEPVWAIGSGLAATPVFDRLWRDYPHAQLAASGAAVGLPEGQMGNSEVGHLTIGSGRILFQDLVRVNRAIESGELFENDALRGAFERGENVHLLGLVSHGGVHSHIDHLQALLTFAPEKTWIHAFTDGRDVSPHSAVHDLTELPVDRIATVVGRYYAMDRDKRWERTERALRAIVNGEGERSDDPVAAVQA